MKFNNQNQSTFVKISVRNLPSKMALITPAAQVTPDACTPFYSNDNSRVESSTKKTLAENDYQNTTFFQKVT